MVFGKLMLRSISMNVNPRTD